MTTMDTTHERTAQSDDSEAETEIINPSTRNTPIKPKDMKPHESAKDLKPNSTSPTAPTREPRRIVSPSPINGKKRRSSDSDLSEPHTRSTSPSSIASSKRIRRSRERHDGHDDGARSSEDDDIPTDASRRDARRAARRPNAPDTSRSARSSVSRTDASSPRDDKHDARNLSPARTNHRRSASLHAASALAERERRTRRRVASHEASMDQAGSAHASSAMTRKRDHHGRTALAKACDDGNEERVEALLASNSDELNEADYAGNTPLQFACNKGYASIVKMLLKAGANMYTVNRDGDTPWKDAEDGEHDDVMDLLRNNGFDASRATIQHEKQYPKNRHHFLTFTPKALLKYVEDGDKEAVGTLTSNGIKINNQHVVTAVRKGYTDILNVLIALGGVANPPPSRFKETPMEAALDEGTAEMVKLFRNQSDFDPLGTVDGQPYYKLAGLREGSDWTKERQALRDAYAEKKRKLGKDVEPDEIPEHHKSREKHHEPTSADEAARDVAEEDKPELPADEDSEEEGEIQEEPIAAKNPRARSRSPIKHKARQSVETKDEKPDRPTHKLEKSKLLPTAENRHSSAPTTNGVHKEQQSRHPPGKSSEPRPSSSHRHADPRPSSNHKPADTRPSSSQKPPASAVSHPHSPGSTRASNLAKSPVSRSSPVPKSVDSRPSSSKSQPAVSAANNKIETQSSAAKPMSPLGNMTSLTQPTKAAEEGIPPKTMDDVAPEPSDPVKASPAPSKGNISHAEEEADKENGQDAESTNGKQSLNDADGAAAEEDAMDVDVPSMPSKPNGVAQTQSAPEPMDVDIEINGTSNITAPKSPTPPSPVEPPVDLPRALAKFLTPGKELPLKGNELSVKSLSDSCFAITETFRLGYLYPDCADSEKEDIYMVGFQASLRLRHHSLTDISRLSPFTVSTKPMSKEHRLALLGRNDRYRQMMTRDFWCERASNATIKASGVAYTEMDGLLTAQWRDIEREDKEKFLNLPETHALWVKLDDYLRLTAPEHTPHLRDHLTQVEGRIPMNWDWKDVEKSVWSKQKQELPSIESKMFSNGVEVPWPTQVRPVFGPVRPPTGPASQPV